MVAGARRPELLAIVGPTASGKSELAMSIAKDFKGEIINADSRVVYKGMDIGTAKPSKNDRAKVRQWGLDLVEPGQRFTAAQFKAYAEDKIRDSQTRCMLPILVGGTGLYIDSVLFNFGFRKAYKPRLRSQLAKMSVQDLQEQIKKYNLTMPENSQNKRYLIRTLETEGQEPLKSVPRPNTLVVGLLPSAADLKTNIKTRAERMFKEGFINETAALSMKYGKSFESVAGIGYKLCLSVLRGELTETEALELFKTKDWQYARRQRTWFKRNPYIKWFNNSRAAYSFVAKSLNK